MGFAVEFWFLAEFLDVVTYGVFLSAIVACQTGVSLNEGKEEEGGRKKREMRSNTSSDSSVRYL